MLLRRRQRDPKIIEQHTGDVVWFNGTRPGYDRAGEDLPVGARMLSIVDAFDAMTTDHVYRKALSRERAMAWDSLIEKAPIISNWRTTAVP